MEKYWLSVFLSFYVYSFAGWIWESLILPVTTHRHPIHNSGFLNGPIVPIYGVGAIVVYLLFDMKESFLSVFLSGAVVATTIEYLTSWVLEKIYHRRWWDYSTMKFNLHGRICLAGFLVFGVFSVVDIKFTEPVLVDYFSKYSLNLLVSVSAVLALLTTIDFVVTVVSLLHLEEHLVSIETNFKNTVLELKENLEIDNEVYHIYEQYLSESKNIVEAIRELKIDPNVHAMVGKRNYVNKRIVKAFPELLRGKIDEK